MTGHSSEEMTAHYSRVGADEKHVGVVLPTTNAGTLIQLTTVKIITIVATNRTGSSR